MERNQLFTYSSFSQLTKRDDLLKEIITTAEILESGNAHILKVGDFYLNEKKDGLYFVIEIQGANNGNRRITVDPLFSLKAGGFSRNLDFISGALLAQKVHILNVKRVFQE